jgi:hypothetical protein
MMGTPIPMGTVASTTTSHHRFAAKFDTLMEKWEKKRVKQFVVGIATGNFT